MTVVQANPSIAPKSSLPRTVTLLHLFCSPECCVMPLPALDRMFITAAWLQSTIYGMHPHAASRFDADIPLNRNQMEKGPQRLTLRSFSSIAVCYLAHAFMHFVFRKKGHIGSCHYITCSFACTYLWIRIILISCIFHFSIATAHNILSLLYALQGLTNPAIISVPDGSTLYFARITTLSLTMVALYIFNVGIVFLL